jgi:regulatory GntR family protein/helix-turn-helix protein
VEPTDRNAGDTSLLPWQTHLVALVPPARAPGYPKPGERETYRTAIKAARNDGAAFRKIADFIGRSYGFVYRHANSPDPKPPKTAKRNPEAERICAILRDRIAEGEYPEGSRFPTVRALRDEFDTNFSTLTDALQPLKDDGLLVRTGAHKSGTYVHASARSLLTEAAQ